MDDFSIDVENCLKVLIGGGIILYPTDTVWGLGCDATNEDAVNKLSLLKGKEAGNGLIVLLTSERDLLKYVTQLDLSVLDYLKGSTKPTTVIYEGGTGVCNDVLASDGSIAIRLTEDEFCRHLIKRAKKPLVSTSANFHCEATPLSFAHINGRIKKEVDYLSLIHI